MGQMNIKYQNLLAQVEKQLIVKDVAKLSRNVTQSVLSTFLKLNGKLLGDSVSHEFIAQIELKLSNTNSAGAPQTVIFSENCDRAYESRIRTFISKVNDELLASAGFSWNSYAAANLLSIYNRF